MDLLIDDITVRRSGRCCTDPLRTQSKRDNFTSGWNVKRAELVNKIPSGRFLWCDDVLMGESIKNDGFRYLTIVSVAEEGSNHVFVIPFDALRESP